MANFVVEGSAQKDMGDIRRNPATPAGPRAIEETLWDSFSAAAAKFAGNKCHGVRDGATFKWQTYAEVHARVRAVASGIAAWNIPEQANVAIYCGTSSDWGVVELALYSQNIVVVSLYDTLGPDTCEYIINHAEISTVFAHHSKLAGLVALRPKCPQLARIVLMGTAAPDAAAVAAAEAAGLAVCTLASLEESGAAAAAAAPVRAAQPNTLATIMYTSGTTGMPKGVMLEHRSLASAVEGVQNFVRIGESDVALCFLPQAHVYERAMEALLLRNGAALAYWQGDPLKIVEDIAVAQPTVQAVVPRVMCRLHDKVMAGVAAKTPQEQAGFKAGFEHKLAKLDAGLDPADEKWDGLVFNKLKMLLGGRVRIMITGSAAIGKEVMDFFRIAFNCPVLNGWGLTETCAAGAVMDPANWSFANRQVGVVVPSVEVALRSVPEMNYLHTEGTGEVCVRGPSVMRGYYKDAEKTAEVLDGDGWFSTGDIGRWNGDGTLSIIDRKKSIFKLAQGEYVAPDALEAVYARATYVAQVFVEGRSDKAELVAVVVPDAETLKPWAAANGVEGDWNAILANPAVKKLLLADLEATGRAAKVRGFEIIKDIHIEPNMWGPHNFLSPTFKAQRFALRKHYETQIESMYANLS